jgi:hypothetical protein
VVLVGWIAPTKEAWRNAEVRANEAAFLEANGVKLGEWNKATGSWEGCTVDEAAFSAIDSVWGRFHWGLFA